MSRTSVAICLIVILWLILAWKKIVPWPDELAGH